MPASKKQKTEAKGQNGTRYVRVEHSGQYLHMQQVEVFVEGSEKNVALRSEGGKASMSSNYGAGGNCERTIDGDMNKDARWPNSCHTRKGANEWFVVDLGREYVVTKVVVHNRPDCCQNRLAGAQVLLQRDASDAGREIGVCTTDAVQEFAGQKEYPVPAYPGLVLPHGTGAIRDNASAAVNDAVNPFLKKVIGTWMGAIVGQGALKSDFASLDPLKQLVVAEIPGLSDMPPSYNHFGNDDFAAQLCAILETNAFFTASLTPRAGGGFELISFDPTSKNAPYTVRIMREMDRTGPQVNFRFSVKPGGGLAIDGYDAFENGVKIAQPNERKPYGGSASPLQYFASAALYDLFYVAGTNHASIHVMHYVLTNALKYASSESEDAALNKWAVEYNSNINSKYAAVTKVLIALDGEGLLTSPKGLGGTFATLPHLKTNIEAWGKCSSAVEFLDHWFQSPRKDIEAAGLCSEFFKHTNLGSACAVAASTALATDDPSKLATTNEKLQNYIGASGAWAPEENGVKTVQSLVDLMLVTGVIHGGTLSMTRLLNKPQIYRWRNIEEKAWTYDDAKSSGIGLSTIMGVQNDKHASGSITGGVGKWAITTGSLQKALEIFDAEAQKLQKVYQAKIVQRDDFNDVGFLLTDFCTEGFDGKQLTLSTYI